MRRFALLGAALLAAAPVWAQGSSPAASPAAAPATFGACLGDLRRAAVAQGVPDRVAAEALGRASYLPRVIELDRAQPEFFQTFWRYFGTRISDTRVQRGREMLAQHAPLLAQVEGRFGVPARFLVAFWGLESNYGSFTGNFSIVDSLATLACDERRPELFRGELIAALRILAEGAVAPGRLQGSWAGAMGQTQFMPTTFLRYATDFDGDGRRELWSSLPDVFGSSARYLAAIGWKADEPWGREVRLPPNFQWELADPAQRRTLDEWRAAGVREANGAPLGGGPGPGAIILPGGWRGPAFLVFDNFNVILRWNRSLFYAVTVGHLADRLAGGGPLVAPRPAEEEVLSRDDILDLQRRLAALGHDVGERDGVVGAKTRVALRRFQQQNGLPADGYPTAEVLRALRRVTAG